MKVWIPPYQSRPITAVSIVAWFFFWWLLIPIYLFIAAFWVATVVAVNVLLILLFLAKESWRLGVALVATRP